MAGMELSAAALDESAEGPPPGAEGAEGAEGDGCGDGCGVTAMALG